MVCHFERAELMVVGQGPRTPLCDTSTRMGCALGFDTPPEHEQQEMQQTTQAVHTKNTTDG